MDKAEKKTWGRVYFKRWRLSHNVTVATLARHQTFALSYATALGDKVYVLLFFSSLFFSVNTLLPQPPTGFARLVTLNHDLSQRLLQRKSKKKKERSNTHTPAHTRTHTVRGAETRLPWVRESSEGFLENSPLSADKLIPAAFKHSRSSLHSPRRFLLCRALFIQSACAARRLLLECSRFPAIYFWYCSIFPLLLLLLLFASFFPETEWYFHTGLVLLHGPLMESWCPHTLKTHPLPHRHSPVSPPRFE